MSYGLKNNEGLASKGLHAPILDGSIMISTLNYIFS